MKTFHILLLTLLATSAKTQNASIALIPSACDSFAIPIIPTGPYANLVTYEAHLGGQTWELLACTTTLGGNGTVCTPLRTLTTDGIDTVSFTHTPQEFGFPDDYYLNLQMRRYDDGISVFATDTTTMLVTGLPNPVIPECVIALPATSVAELQPAQIEIWPNPCHDYVMVTSNAETSATLYDINGALISETTEASGRHTIDMSNLVAGSYCVLIRDDNGGMARRIIVRE